MLWIFFFLVTLFIRPQDWPGSPVYGLPVNYVISIGGPLTGVFLLLRARRNVSVPVHHFVILFVCLAFISNAGNGLVYDGIDNFIALFKRFIIYIMVVFIVYGHKRIKQTLAFVVLMGIILTLQGAWQSHYGVGWAHQGLHSDAALIEQKSLYCFEQFGTRTFWIGDWDGPNVLSLVYLIGIPFCLEYSTRKGSGLFFRFLSFAALATLCYGIFLTNSRGGFLAMACMAGLFIMMRFGVRYLPVMLILALPLLLVFAPARMKTMNSNESSAHERTWLWEQGLNMTRSNPVFGIGKGQFAKHAGLIAHNNFISSMAETGLPGLFVYCSIVYLTLKSMYSVYKNTASVARTSEYHYLSRVVFITLAGFYIATFFVVMELELLYLLWGICVAVYLSARQENKNIKMTFNARDFGFVTAGSMFIAFAVWLIAVKEIL